MSDLRARPSGTCSDGCEAEARQCHAAWRTANRDAVLQMSSEQVQQEILLELMELRRLVNRVCCGGDGVVVKTAAL